MFFIKVKKNMFFYVFCLQINVFNIYGLKQSTIREINWFENSNAYENAIVDKNKRLMIRKCELAW